MRDVQSNRPFHSPKKLPCVSYFTFKVSGPTILFAYELGMGIGSDKCHSNSIAPILRKCHAQRVGFVSHTSLRDASLSAAHIKKHCSGPLPTSPSSCVFSTGTI